MLLDNIIKAVTKPTNTHNSGRRGKKKYIIKSLQSALDLQQSKHFHMEEWANQYTCANRLINTEMQKNY